jgi:hypothetical protein
MSEPLAQLQNLIPASTTDLLGHESLSWYTSHLPLLKTMGFFASCVFIGLTIFFAIRTGWIATRVNRVQDVILKSNVPKKRSIKIWQRVQEHFYAGDDNSLKLAILEADKILDEALRLAGFRGESLGDRLKKLDESKLPNLQDVWEAHKLRNRLVHETDFKLNRNTAERALAIYEQSFKDLGLLD